MSVFKVMDGEFGTDGLISSHSVFVADTSDECFHHILELAQSGPLFVRGDAAGYWVEEHESADRKSKPIWVQLPYPQVSRPDYPNWFKTEMHKVVFPTREELRAELDRIHQAGLEAIRNGTLLVNGKPMGLNTGCVTG